MKRILLSAVVLCAATSINAQIMNGNLESWTDVGGGQIEPDSWLYDYGAPTGIAPGTNNWIITLGEGDPLTTIEVTGAAAAGGSGSSALLETKDAVGATAIGAGFPILTGLLLGEFTYSGANPIDFTFDYKVSAVTGDSAIVQISFTDAGGQDVGFANMIWDDATLVSSWTPMTLPIQYTGPGTTIANIEVWAQSSYSADGSIVTGSTLHVDNFAVSGVNGLTELNFSTSVYPNPASDVLNIKANANSTSVSIIAMDGKVVYTSSIDSNEASIDVSNLNSGVYYYQVVSEDGNVIRDTFVKK